MTIAELIQAKYSGSLSDGSMYINLILQTVAVMIGGIILWKLFSAYHRRKMNDREEHRYFKRPYSKHWKR